MDQAKLLATYPSDSEIHDILALAEKRAQVLIEFTGMGVVPRAKATHLANHRNIGEDPIAEDDSVSVAITKRYDIVYRTTTDDPQTAASLHTAASITQARHNLDCELEAIDDSVIESLEVAANRMSIANLLNPQGE